ncbi:AfsR/SARP family transcriptional regulator [Cryptosporangium phraense]|uniref:Tetratricopeptide repeat protein n=1 Tax=Cryptosporangium phraense TaxID=2593070 RepID=A0A545AKR5_9ACTN|nr:BTAD domain-containing putative transcriptional regulator [Cryptosporangium phraense]TQS41916.1 tetratricopeptide repeat protein [Cryptosporangium phraense]
MAFRLLGDLEVQAADGRPVAAGRRKQRVLLVMLLLRAGSVIRADEIIDALWDGYPPSSARANLHSYVFGVRHVLDQVAPGGSSRLVTSSAGYRLDVDGAQCDVDVFDALAADGRRALDRGRHREALDHLTRALGLWRGPFLPDLADLGWLVPHAARLAESRLTAVEDRAEACLALGEHAGLVAELAAAAAENRLRERLWVAYIRALQATGQRTEALAAYETIRAALADELGVDPGRALQGLYAQLLDEPAPPEHRPPALLPPAVADFTGRTEEVRRLRKALSPHTPPAGLTVLGITGMAGVGKTTLAVHVAHSAAPAYPDGRLFANLAGAGPNPVPAADVLARFLRALGVPSPAVPPDPDERAELYRTLLDGRRVLVVLDNAASEAQVRPLLPGTAGCTVLLTSRVRLSGLEGARWSELDVLGEEDGVHMLARIVNDARVDDDGTANTEAADVVHLCGGLPLAVRIAGARLTSRPSWTLARLVALLRDEKRRLDRLDIGDLQVRASLALSEDALRPSARRLFRALATVDGPDLPGWLATVLSDESPERASRDLDDLVDAHVLTAVGTDAAGPARYRFHDLVRLYARDAGTADSADTVLRTAAGGWLAVAEQLEPGLPGPCYAPLPGPAYRPDVSAVLDDLAGIEPLDWFDAEQAGARAVIRQACAAGLHEVAFDLAQRLEKYFDVRGMYAEWAATNRLVLAACRRAGNRRGEAVMLRGLVDVETWIAEDQSREAMAGSLADALALQEKFVALGELGGAADAAGMYSWGLTAAGRRDEGIAAAEQALAWATEVGHLGGQARAHVALALAYRESVQLAEAVDHLQRALERARELGNPRWIATVLQFLGIGYSEYGLLDEGEAFLTESLAISERHQDSYTSALTRIGLARLHLRRGDAEARPSAEAALALAREHRMTHHMADALGILGEIALNEGRPAEAAEYLRESVALWRTRGWPRFQAAALVLLGRALNDPALNEPAAAAEAWREAHALFVTAGDAEGAATAAQLLESSEA